MSESELQHRLLSHLAERREFMTGGMKNANEFHYKGIPDFVLREGQFFEPRPLPDGMSRLEIKHCFKNAFWTALQERFVYVEGYAVSSSHDLPLLHAWNLDREGFVVDTTWNPHGRTYFGVIFPLAAVRRERGKQYPVIDNWEHGYPILRNPWDGEAARNHAFREFSSTKGTAAREILSARVFKECITTNGELS